MHRMQYGTLAPRTRESRTGSNKVNLICYKILKLIFASYTDVLFLRENSYIIEETEFEQTEKVVIVKIS